MCLHIVTANRYLGWRVEDSLLVLFPFTTGIELELWLLQICLRRVDTMQKKEDESFVADPSILNLHMQTHGLIRRRSPAKQNKRLSKRRAT